MAVAIAQGGSGFPFLYEGVYQYLSGKEASLVTVTPTAIPDFDIQQIVDKVVHPL